VYTDDAFTLDRAPSFDMRCLSDTCPREAERRADCNTGPLDFVRGMVDATVVDLRASNARLADSGAAGDGDVVSGGDASATAGSERSDEDYCAESLTLILELSSLTAVRGDCRSAQQSSAAMLQAIAAVARRRRRPAGTPVPFRDASVTVDP
jgi:hypothetical protein